MVKDRWKRWLAPIAGLALGLAVFGASGLSVAQAQQEDVIVGGAADDAFINSLIEQIFAEVFGGGVADDEAAVSGGGDINVGGNVGGSVTMGGSSGGGISVGGSGGSGGITVGGMDADG